MFDLHKFSLRAQEIIEAGKFLYGAGWSPATSSNYSARIDDANIAITVSGKHKGRLQAQDIMVVDLQGRAVASQMKSSAETLLHTVIYDLKPNVGAVLHTHSVTATVLSRALRPNTEIVFEDYELQKAFRGVYTHEGRCVVPIFDNTQDIEALSALSVEYLKEHSDCPGYLIRGHGMYTWGETMAECLRHVEAMEFLLACELEMMRIKS
ncbi:methylthioribulose 1-phosphate dehydratase [Hahella aquimaris]|uniref:methylthioribulose 1-phosphate dehydratase n=1 Tax=Hahella sp. HNIBRBA332 TaxID=3015983 RepID=UPI00273A84DD|nr:methylthioribulose 1-phosphate dehydratase [Hahella sp. HNIBRBA332]WLQ11475.1 methylthioribulose 1-phosphate dehydratase [Hahella sp. HNIBRBA332]